MSDKPDKPPDKQPRCTSCGRPADPTVLLKIEGHALTAAIMVCGRCRPGAERLLTSLELAVESRVIRAIASTGPGTDPPVDLPKAGREADAAPATPRIGRGERTPIRHQMTRLERDLAVVDTEWNSSNTDEAEVIAVGVVRLRPDGTGYRAAYTVKPSKPVDPRTTAVHGLTDEMLAELPPFKAYAQQILEDLTDADVGGYTVTNDLTLIERALEAAGLAWATEGVKVVDALRIWQTAEPRRLTDAHERFVGPGEGILTAHDAGDDAMMTARVIEALAGQSTAADIQELTDPGRVDLTGRFRRDEHNEVVFDFGKYRHQPARLEPRQLRWILERGFAPSAKAVARRILEEHHPERDTLDPAGRFAKDDTGEVIFNFGKYKGQPARLEPGFLNWMLGKDFPEATKTVARKVLAGQHTQADAPPASSDGGSPAPTETS